MSERQADRPVAYAPALLAGGLLVLGLLFEQLVTLLAVVLIRRSPSDRGRMRERGPSPRVRPERFRAGQLRELEHADH